MLYTVIREIELLSTRGGSLNKVKVVGVLFANSHNKPKTVPLKFSSAVFYP